MMPLPHTSLAFICFDCIVQVSLWEEAKAIARADRILNEAQWLRQTGQNSFWNAVDNGGTFLPGFS